MNVAAPIDHRDPELIRRYQPVLELYTRYFRPTVRGFELLPPSGPMLLVGNHSGGATAPDLPILCTEWWRRRGVDDPLYGLMHSFVIGLPGLGRAARGAGAIEASPAAATDVLARGGSLVVYPGGDHEVYRPSTDRDRIDFGGRDGWVRLALRTGVPIVPVVSCGAHDGVFVLSRGERLAAAMPLLRRMRMRVMPVTVGPPWGLAVGVPTLPLPSQVTVELGAPIRLADRFGPDAADDDAVVAACYRDITTAMQATLDQLAAERRRSPRTVTS